MFTKISIIVFFTTFIFFSQKAAYSQDSKTVISLDECTKETSEKPNLHCLKVIATILARSDLKLNYHKPKKDDGIYKVLTEIRDRLGRDNNHQTVYKRVDEIEIKLQSINDKLDRLIAQLGYDGRDASVFEQLDSIGNMIRR